MNIDRHMVPVLLLVNIHVHANTCAIFFTGPRPHFFDDSRMFFHYNRGRRRWGGCICGRGSYRRRRLLTSGDPK